MRIEEVHGLPLDEELLELELDGVEMRIPKRCIRRQRGRCQSLYEGALQLDNEDCELLDDDWRLELPALDIEERACDLP